MNTDLKRKQQTFIRNAEPLRRGEQLKRTGLSSFLSILFILSAKWLGFPGVSVSFFIVFNVGLQFLRVVFFAPSRPAFDFRVHLFLNPCFICVDPCPLNSVLAV